jgi:uncharacterized protein with GYD domain
MRTYITLLRFTQKGAETIREGPSRLDAAGARFRAAGGELRAFYLTMGRYDAVAISEAPHDETAAKLAFAAGALGTVRTETLRAFPEDEYRRMVAALP